MGYQVLAVSADSPEHLAQSKAKHQMGYRLLSDHSMAGARALGIAWKMDTSTYMKYKQYGIDVEQASGEKHRILPVPAAFIIGTDSKISFVYANPDHTVRVPSRVLLEAAKAGIK